MLTLRPWQALALLCLGLQAALFILDTARGFLMPAVAGIVLAVILAPACRRLESVGLPPAPASLATVLLALALTVALVVPLAPAFDDWSQRLPRVAQQLEFELREVKKSVEKLEAATREVKDATDLKSDKSEKAVVIRDKGLVTDAVTSAPALLAQVSFSTLLAFFLLSQRRQLLRSALRLMPDRAAARRLCRVSRDIGRVVSRYLFTVACINVCLGLATAIALFLFGLPNALLWGTGMALLNFVPFLGPAVMLAIVFGVGVATFGTALQALAPVGVILLFNILESQFVLPAVVGHRVAMNPLAVFLSIAFWGWLWGVPGIIVAVPVTLILATAARHAINGTAVGGFPVPRFPMPRST